MTEQLGDDSANGWLLLGGPGGARPTLAQALRSNGGATLASHPALSTGISFSGSISVGGGGPSNGAGSFSTGHQAAQR